MDTVVQLVLNAIHAASLYSLVALGLTLILGVLDIADFAQGALYMVGAYVAYFATSQLGISFFLALPLAMVVGSIFAMIPSGAAVSPTALNNPELQLLEGAPPIYSIAYAISQVDGAAPGAGSDPAPKLYLGAVSLGETDWTAGWTFGLHADSQSQPLWFETL